MAEMLDVDIELVNDKDTFMSMCGAYSKADENGDEDRKIGCTVWKMRDKSKESVVELRVITL